MSSINGVEATLGIFGFRPTPSPFKGEMRVSRLRLQAGLSSNVLGLKVLAPDSSRHSRHSRWVCSRLGWLAGLSLSLSLALSLSPLRHPLLDCWPPLFLFSGLPSPVQAVRHCGMGLGMPCLDRPIRQSSVISQQRSHQFVGTDEPRHSASRASYLHCCR